MTRTRRGILYGAVLIGMAVPLLFWVVANFSTAPRTAVAAPVSRSIHNNTVRPHDVDPKLLALVKSDPLELVRLGHKRHDREIHDYRCTLIKQERLGGKLSPVQEVEVRFRNAPRAIYMLWRANEGDARRALYKDSPEYVDEDGQKLVRVEPAGAIARLFVTDIFMPLHGERARKASRRSLDECGFETLFELMDKYCTEARAADELKLSYIGLGEVDGRKTFMIERHLPYTGEGGKYPDAKMILHMDCEWLLPVAVESYADDAGTELLGRYVFTNVELNPGLTEDDFAF